MSDSAEIAAISQPASIFDPVHVEIARDAMVAACKATKTVRSRNAEGVIGYVDVPDHPTRIVAATKVIEFARGKAVATSVIANLTPNSPAKDSGDFLRAVLDDKESRAALLDTVKKLVAAADKANPIEVAATSALPALRKPSA